MNEILTCLELQVLVLLLGADRYFGVSDPERSLDRETLLQTVAELCRKDLLTPEEKALRLRPELRRRLTPVAFPDRVISLSAPDLPQLSLYRRDGLLTLVTLLPNRAYACKLNTVTAAELMDVLEEDYLPELASETDDAVPGVLPQVFAADRQTLLDAVPDLRLLVECYQDQNLQYRGVINALAPNRPCFTTWHGGETVSRGYHKTEFETWLRSLLEETAG